MTRNQYLGIAGIAIVAGAVGAGITIAVANEGNEQSEGAEQNEATEAPTAKIAEDSARKIALALVPGGKTAPGDLESENGVWIYSFDIAVAGKEGVEEVHVRASDGAVLSREYESVAAEAAEKAKEGEKKEAKEGKAGKGLTR